MKYWTRRALQHKFHEISQRAERISTEFQLGHPDHAVCDRLLRSLFSDIGEILRQKKEHGWPSGE